MEADVIHLTDAEWQVMECLWASAPQTGRALTDALAGKMGWSRSTTLTLLRRLEAKGAVRSTAEGGIKAFSPAVAREDAVLSETQALLARAYQGSVSLLVSAMTKRQRLPQSEIDELHALLDQLEAKP